MKKTFTKISLAVVLFASNASVALADGYGHLPVDTAFELDAKTVSAGIALILFSAGAAFVLEGVFFKNTPNA